jgi:hypothetical protein
LISENLELFITKTQKPHCWVEITHPGGKLHTFSPCNDSEALTAHPGKIQMKFLFQNIG